MSAFLLIVTVACWGISRITPATPVPPEFAKLRIDPNHATREELMLLPGIGPAMADSIVADRNATADAPPYRHADELGRVRRIGPRTIEHLRPHLSFRQVKSEYVR
ncbi:MAG: helix-hairpin-helix domain-containing protein [Planctomycetes bacterium]|nr:helix-hairpin-helix domain-containing protein [Planctomycetota bacterium]